jgi:RHH-type transcriptional regulator, rel operon repressor / antitoxin RelB
MHRSEATMTIQIPVEVKADLEELSRMTATPEASLAAAAIAAYVDLQKWQIQQIEEGLREAEAGEFATDEEMAEIFSRWKNAR